MLVDLHCLKFIAPCSRRTSPRMTSDVFGVQPRAFLDLCTRLRLVASLTFQPLLPQYGCTVWPIIDDSILKATKAGCRLKVSWLKSFYGSTHIVQAYTLHCGSSINLLFVIQYRMGAKYMVKEAFESFCLLQVLHSALTTSGPPTY
jgi:hypothetical protein